MRLESRFNVLHGSYDPRNMMRGGLELKLISQLPPSEMQFKAGVTCWGDLEGNEDCFKSLQTIKLFVHNDNGWHLRTSLSLHFSLA